MSQFGQRFGGNPYLGLVRLVGTHQVIVQLPHFFLVNAGLLAHFGHAVEGSRCSMGLGGHLTNGLRCLPDFVGKFTGAKAGGVHVPHLLNIVVQALEAFAQILQNIFAQIGLTHHRVQGGGRCFGLSAC